MKLSQEEKKTRFTSKRMFAKSQQDNTDNLNMPLLDEDDKPKIMLTKAQNKPRRPLNLNIITNKSGAVFDKMSPNQLLEQMKEKIYAKETHSIHGQRKSTE